MARKLFAYRDGSTESRALVCNDAGALKVAMAGIDLVYSKESVLQLSGQSVTVTLDQGVRVVDICAIVGDVYVALKSSASPSTAPYRISEGLTMRIPAAWTNKIYVYGVQGAVAGVVQWK